MAGKDAPLNNNSFFRGLSNGLDKALGTTYDNTKDSKIRGTVHAAYHQTMALKNNNPREAARAKDQWNTAWGGPTDNHQKYMDGLKAKAKESGQ